MGTIGLNGGRGNGRALYGAYPYGRPMAERCARPGQAGKRGGLESVERSSVPPIGPAISRADQ